MAPVCQLEAPDDADIKLMLKQVIIIVSLSSNIREEIVFVRVKVVITETYFNNSIEFNR